LQRQRLSTTRRRGAENDPEVVLSYSTGTTCQMDCTNDPVCWLFRVRDHIFDAVGIIRDREKEAPGPVDAGLPNVAASSYFLAWSDGCCRFTARNRICFSKARRTFGGASFKSSMARSDKTISIAYVVLGLAAFLFLISLRRKATAWSAVLNGP